MRKESLKPVFRNCYLLNLSRLLYYYRHSSRCVSQTSRNRCLKHTPTLSQVEKKVGIGFIGPALQPSHSGISLCVFYMPMSIWQVGDHRSLFTNSARCGFRRWPASLRVVNRWSWIFVLLIDTFISEFSSNLLSSYSKFQRNECLACMQSQFSAAQIQIRKA